MSVGIGVCTEGTVIVGVDVFVEDGVSVGVRANVGA